MKFDYKNIHIGKLISVLVENRNIEENRIEKLFKCESFDLEKVYKSESLDANQLLKWSKLLDYDLFRVYSQHLLLYSSVNTSKINYISSSNNHESKVPSFKKNIYTPEIIEFILSLINNKEKTISEVIKEYKIPKTTLYRWIKKY